MTIRLFDPEDRERILDIMQAAFAGFPWFEALSRDEVVRRLDSQMSLPEFEAIVAENDDGIVMGAHWFDRISFSRLRQERGEELAHWVAERFVDCFPQLY